ncbi:MAG: hypothetical protein IT314_15945 [Anaerolineales bacterium]|nr:hypothetical protein [Anaerolineales bacterium]
MKTARLFWLVVFVLALLPSGVASADIGPKPTMDFEFRSELDGAQVAITSGILYECEQADCADASPLEELGPQRLTCEEFHCSALAYGFAPYHRLEIQFSDGTTRQSNIFETIDFESRYRVTVRADDLLVEEVSGSPAPPELNPGSTAPPTPNPGSTALPELNRDSSAPGFPAWVGILVVCAILLLLIGLAVGLALFLRRRARQ